MPHPHAHSRQRSGEQDHNGPNAGRGDPEGVRCVSVSAVGQPGSVRDVRLSFPFTLQAHPTWRYVGVAMRDVVI